MAFNSFNFWLVFPFLFCLYWAIPTRAGLVRKIYLILVSYSLYMNWKPWFAFVLLGVTLTTYYGAKLIDSCKKTEKRYLLCLFFAILVLFPLLLFKYYNFINDSIHVLLTSIGMDFALPGLNWVVPIGISFFTFQAIGYMLDVYHERISAEKNIVDYFLFICFFPQITSGPISKASELLPQIKAPHDFNYHQAVCGLKFLLWGMFLKVLLADRLGISVDTIYGNYEHYNGTTCLLASIFYSLQIYADFAGYSLMAIGIGRLLGFDLVNNFQRPYFADSITNFWKRWHISLTRWLTTHVYIALGGNRCSKSRQYWNIMVTFIVSGLWHGANWTFVIWGLLHGILQIFEKVLGIDSKGEHANSRLLTRFKPLRILGTLLLVNFAWIFFRMPTINDAFSIITKIFTSYGGIDVSRTLGGPAGFCAIFIGLMILMTKEIYEEYFTDKLTFFQRPLFKWVLYVILFVSIVSLGVMDGGQFIYVSF